MGYEPIIFGSSKMQEGWREYLKQGGAIPQGLYQVEEKPYIVLNIVELRRDNAGWILI
jgi:hypothetical protein